MTPFRLAGFALAATMFFPAGASAQAVADRRLRELGVIIRNDRVVSEFGRYPVFMRQLAKARRTCKLAYTWDWGASVQCDAGNGVAEDRVLISMNFAPSRSPEFLEIGTIQPKGRDGGEIKNPAEIEVFMRDYLRLPPKPAN
jgi:hypothetical protein